MESYQQHCDRSVILIPIFKWGNTITVEKFFELFEFVPPVRGGAEFQSQQQNFKAKVASVSYTAFRLRTQSVLMEFIVSGQKDRM